MNFSHLHVHTQYSLLDGAAGIKSLVAKTKQYGMNALAITDHGNMFGVPEFVNEMNRQNMKPIIGCEFYLARGSRFDKSKKIKEDNTEKHTFHQVLLAKNAAGYKNLSRLSSLGFTEGFYYKPRIDKEILIKYSEGLIATTCCLASEINQTILSKGETEAEKIFLEWLDIFGEDYYIELQRHGIDEQNRCNEVLVKWSKKYNVKMIATNDVHYIDKQDSQAQDILLCLQTGKDFDDPKRMRFDGNQFYLKPKEEMQELFKDIPESIDNTNEIACKIETPELKRDVLLPVYKLPEGFISEDEYLKHLSYEGAKRRYGEITASLQERLDYELKIIQQMGFAGYFLIVQDFITAARTLGVTVGPGRGSAAGSVIAYCTGITSVDPIAYNLIFERFLNPERLSMPDIDIDFDDDGRQKVIDWVVNKYGRDKVAQIITFGTMAAKSAIRDVARVLKLPLAEADRLAKLIPDGPAVNLKQAFKDVKELADAKKSKDPTVIKTLAFAETLEGCARHTGIHAAGIIIGPDNLMDHIPVCISKDSNLLVTQYEGTHIENVGMLKMDFLGLKTLSIINDAIETIELRHKIKIDSDKIPLDDAKTFRLYQRGETVGTFQFESEGMRQYLKDLKPTNIEDLIAMNALYRPGAMDDIPSYINRKNSKKKIVYPHPSVEQILKSTFGVIVYQEQVMLIVQQIGGFTMGQADNLRKAMGKKNMQLLEKQREQFIIGSKEKGMDVKSANELFDRMAKFGGYGFNRSHSAAYSILAYQTAWLKANYTAEYMAAVLTRNKNDIKKITFFMDACKRQSIQVLGPDINESAYKFAVNKKGEIRFGLGAVKGVGEGAVESIVNERNTNGNYQSIFDLTRRINLRLVNKKSLESLIMAGAFDCFKGVHRSQYFHAENSDGAIFLDKAIRFGSQFQNGSNSEQISMFSNESIQIKEPQIPTTEPWSKLETLVKEREVTGMYLSGHPLDNYRFEINNFCDATIAKLNENLLKFKNREVCIAGIITEAQHRTTKTGNPFGTLVLEDYTDSMKLAIFSEDYLKLRHFLKPDEFVFIKGKVQLRYKSEDQYEFRISHIQLLSEVRNKLAKSITMNVNLTDLSDKFIEDLTQLINTNAGQCRLNLIVGDKTENHSVEMQSKSYKIELTNEFIKTLDNLPEVQYKLN